MPDAVKKKYRIEFGRYKKSSEDIRVIDGWVTDNPDSLQVFVMMDASRIVELCDGGLEIVFWEYKPAAVLGAKAMITGLKAVFPRLRPSKRKPNYALCFDHSIEPARRARHRRRLASFMLSDLLMVQSSENPEREDIAFVAGHYSGLCLALGIELSSD